MNEGQKLRRKVRRQKMVRDRKKQRYTKKMETHTETRQDGQVRLFTPSSVRRH